MFTQHLKKSLFLEIAYFDKQVLVLNNLIKPLHHYKHAYALDQSENRVGNKKCNVFSYKWKYLQV